MTSSNDRVRYFITEAASYKKKVDGKYVRHLLSTIHSNPYPFKNPEPYFRTTSKDRWSWYALSGQLFWSKERILFQHQCLRDYVARILKRWIRRYGKHVYLSKRKAFDFYDRVSNRWNWGMPMNTKYKIPAQDNFASSGHWDTYMSRSESVDRWRTDAPYSRVAYWNEKGDSFDCPTCLGQAMAYKQLSENNKYYEDTKYTCLNRLCREATNFMEGKHDLWSAACKLKVFPGRPLTKYNKAPPESKGIIAIAALLDFEARYEQKKNSHHETS